MFTDGSEQVGAVGPMETVAANNGSVALEV